MPIDALCQEAYLIASSSYLQTIYSLKFFISCIGVISVVYLHRKKGSSWIPNPNAKVLYRAHLLLAFHVNVAYSFLYFYQIVRTMIVFEDPCSYLINAHLSSFLKMIPVFGIHSQSFNMLTFATYIVFSTISPRSSERTTKPYLGLSLVVVSMLIALIMEIVCDILPVSSELMVTGITLRNSQNSSTYQITCFLPLALETLTITIFGATFFLNKSKRLQLGMKSPNLGDKYQIEENKKVIKTLFPCFLVHFLLNIFSYGGLGTYTFLNSRFEFITSAAWIEYFSQAQIYTIIMPWIVFWQTRKGRRVDVLDCDAETDRHFQQLFEVWKVESPQ